MWLRKVLSVVLLLFWVVYYALSTQYSAGTLRSPLAGLMPRSIGVLALILCAINMIMVFGNDIKAKIAQLRGKAQPKTDGGQEGAEDEDKFTPETRKIWLKILAFLAASFVFIYTMSFVGYLIGSTLYMIILMRLATVKKWSTTILVAVGTSFFFWFLFSKLMMVNLPNGSLLRLFGL